MSSTRAGFDDELAFWDEQISGKGQYSAGVLIRLDLTRQPPEYRYDFEPLILQLGRESGRFDPMPIVLDVGSGPASIFSYGAAQGRFRLVAADPLASEYVEILRKYGYQTTSDMIPTGGEDLGRHLSPHSCDFSWSYNAIDHAEDPGRVFDQMVLVTRPGGVIAIQVFENEATAANWGDCISIIFQVTGPAGWFVRRRGSHACSHILMSSHTSWAFRWRSSPISKDDAG